MRPFRAPALKFEVKVVGKATALTWETVDALSDDTLERTLYGPKLALTWRGRGPIWSGCTPSCGGRV